MGMSLAVAGFSFSTDTLQTKIMVHVSLHGCFAEMNSVSVKEYFHRTMPNNSVQMVINFLDFGIDVIPVFIIFRLCITAIVIVGIRTDFHMPEQPPKADLILILVNESISPESISFATNAAAFLGSYSPFRVQIFPAGAYGLPP